MFDKNDPDIKDGWFNEYGVPNGNTQYKQKCSGWIKVKPNNTYVQNLGNTNNQYCFYDKNKNFLKRTHYPNDSINIITTTPDTHYIRIMVTASQIGALYLMEGDAEQKYEPYTEELYQLPQTLELAKYDSFNPQTGEITRRTGYFTSETILTEEELANYNNPIVSADGKSLVYELANPTIEKVENAPTSYIAYNQGTETVLQGETDNSVYGALPSVKNDYLVIVGGEEDEI